jgi:hypothetical protein
MAGPISRRIAARYTPPRGDSVNKILTWFIRIWVAFAVIVNVVSIITLILSEGWGRVADIYSPFNVINSVMELVLLSPAIGAYFWLEHRRKNERVPSTPASVASDRTANKTATQIALDEHIKKTSAYLGKLWPSGEEIARLRHWEPMITKEGWDKVFKIIAIVFITAVILMFGTAFLQNVIP